MFAPARRLQHLTLSTQHEHRYVCTHKGVSATRYTRGSLRFYAPIRGTVWSKRWSNKLRLIHRGILQRQSMLLTQHTQALLVPEELPIRHGRSLRLFLFLRLLLLVFFRRSIRLGRQSIHASRRHCFASFHPYFATFHYAVRCQDLLSVDRWIS